MTRRSFSMTLAGALAVSRPPTQSRAVIFEATAGARLPHTLALRTTARESFSIQEMRGHIWELRTYSIAADLGDRFAEIFLNAGIRPLINEAKPGSVTYLIPFENLAARDRAWTELNADPRWITARARIKSYQFGLYRLV